MATKTAKQLFGYNSILPNLEQKERVFILKGNKSPIRLMIAVKHTSRKPLTYFDGNLNRALRYATNQLSPFQDEQDGVATMEPIVFENGTLIVPDFNVNLQKFLMIHPEYNKTFFLLDKEANASKEVEEIYTTLEAQVAAKNLDINDLEAIARVCLSSSASNLSSSELRRDMILYAKSNPTEFMNLVNDENLKLRNIAAKAVEMGILHIKSDNRTVVWNKDRKKKVIMAPFGENVYSALGMYFKTDEGLDVLQKITNSL
ncbi:MAG: hypothetical protein GOVbin3171_37 [Prokaryotic dsDNA virus sp.]|nr:MAG: hypothetical protein GOVbin3171_37 [Prokaryotic dsDNA virus sp.]|tara:strand:- start:10679 stop:11455 length:777 start_codon:yes stop_codon:yes gene_type:complete